MTARTPSSISPFPTESEREVFNYVVKQLGDDCWVIPNLRITDEYKDYEADLLVLMPGSGVVVVEVKGSHCWVDDGQWMINRGGESMRIDPVGQAIDAQYALRKYVHSDPRWGSRSPVRWAHHIVMPYTKITDDFAMPDCPRALISGEQEVNFLGERLWDTTSLYKKDAREPDHDDVDLILEILSGRSLPATDPQALAEDREAAAQRLTLEQANLLKVTRLLNRVEIRGGAGSGKTVMAMQQARDLTTGRLREDRQNQRVAVVCYSYGLAHFLKRELKVGPRKKQPAFVGNFEQLGAEWGIDSTGQTASDYFEETLPELMAQRALELTEGQKFDAIIVDEAQDFAQSWWTPLLRALKDEEASGLFVYSDERQRVFPRFGQPPVALVPLVLDHNLRNTRQIADTFAPLAPRMDARGAEGVDVSFIASDEPLDDSDDAVEMLFEEGWEAGDIALITMGRRHPVQKERQEALGPDGYWADFWSNEDIFYGHVLGMKGLERRAVVLCVNEYPENERAAEKLYVGLSRATDRLIVVGEPDVVRQIGGPEVAQRLGI